MSKIRATLIAFIVGSMAAIPCGFARISTDQLETAIGKAKILPSDTKINCTITDAELTASTYRQDQSTGKDCKIDAMLIAKTVFDTDPTLARTTVQFHDVREPNTYYEVSVTVGDVTAYGSGKISQEQILSSLKVTKQTTEVPGAAPVAETPSAKPADQDKTSDTTQTTTTSTTTTSSSTSNGTAAENKGAPTELASAVPTPVIPVITKPSLPAHVEVTSDMATYTNYGVSFKYPRTWKMATPRSGATLIRLYIPGSANTPSIISMQVYQPKDATPISLTAADPRDTFEEDRRQMWVYTVPQILRGALDKGEASWHAEDNYMYHQFMNQGSPSKYVAWKFARRNMWSTLIPTTIPASIKIGTSKSITAVQRGMWIDEPHLSLRYYTREVAFTSSKYTILLGLFAAQINSSQADQQFDQLIASVSAAPPAAPVPASKHK